MQYKNSLIVRLKVTQKLVEQVPANVADPLVGNQELSQLKVAKKCDIIQPLKNTKKLFSLDVLLTQHQIHEKFIVNTYDVFQWYHSRVTCSFVL